jgi:hypothetical protein
LQLHQAVDGSRKTEDGRRKTEDGGRTRRKYEPTRISNPSRTAEAHMVAGL